MGRPRKSITAKHLRQIETLAGYGLTEKQIACVIGLSAATFRRRKEDEDRVLSALEKGQAVAQSVIAQALFVKARNGDLGAIVWWEKTRAGRRELLRIAELGPEAPNLEGLTDEELEARADAVRARVLQFRQRRAGAGGARA